MQLPFSSEQFFEVFGSYNTAVWPAQVLLVALAVAAIVLVFVPWCGSSVAISAILACLWGWIGLVYHLGFFVSINPLAYAFAVLSIAGAGVFVWQGVIRGRLKFNWTVSAAFDTPASFSCCTRWLYIPQFLLCPAMVILHCPHSVCRAQPRCSPWVCAVFSRGRIPAVRSLCRCSGVLSALRPHSCLACKPTSVLLSPASLA